MNFLATVNPIQLPTRVYRISSYGNLYVLTPTDSVALNLWRAGLDQGTSTDLIVVVFDSTDKRPGFYHPPKSPLFVLGGAVGFGAVPERDTQPYQEFCHTGEERLLWWGKSSWL